MCGIIGIIGSHSKESLPRLRDAIAHRGPDDKGEYYDKNLSLGHTRLSILDLSTKGHQPMISADGNYILVYNGEIYNHLEIRKEHLSEFSFRSISDTETLLYGYIKFGKEILNKLKGIFSFCIYNKSTGNVFIARDHFGVKPLYYYHKNETFIFSSEIKSLLNYPDFDKTLSYSSFANYLSAGWSPGETTPFLYIKKLLPGHYIELNSQRPSNVSITKYYELPFDGKYSDKTEEKLTHELEEKLLAAVKKQMLSDSPLGFFLSGGLDSSALVAIARKIYPQKKIQCFTIETNRSHEAEGFSDDLKYAQLVAAHLNVDLEVIRLADKTDQAFDNIVYHLDEPLADTAPLHVLAISRRAKEMGYKVLISGTGADDIFSGYRRHQALHYEKYFRWMPAFLLKFAKEIITRVKGKSARLRRLKKIFTSNAAGKEERMASYFLNISPEKVTSLFNDSARGEIGSYNPLIYFKNVLSSIPDEKSDLNKMLYWETKTYLPDHNLNYMDKMGMAAGVEIRVPFLDKDLVEFSCSIPPSLKMKGITTKYLLRKVMSKYVPQAVLTRSKTGFGIPPAQLIARELENKIRTDLSAEQIRKRNLFNPDKVQTLLKDHQAMKTDASSPIICLLAIEAWYKAFIDDK
ncbi:MAG: asparagine synthase (glutamine-hydrolyzing) [Cytophagaceae bacterium]|nr:asparagine synthase (glutamine-hydrolyzing) [Cytophagaceae bacterium]